MTGQSARWAMLGQSIIGIVHGRSQVMPVPNSLGRLPGPCVLIAERFTESPIGPFSVLSVGELVRIGLRPAVHFGVSVVSSVEARRTGRSYWGFPHQLGTLNWSEVDGEVSVRWEEQELSVSALPYRRPLPFLLPMRSAQVRGDGPVVVPEWMRGMARRSEVTVSAAELGPAGHMGGEWKGYLVSGLRVHRSQARLPSGLLSSLRAPLRSPEPGVAGMDRLHGRSRPRVSTH